MYMNSMGPRGRMHGHRGHGPVFPGILGLIFIAWVLRMVAGGLLVSVIVGLRTVATGIARIAPNLFARVFEPEGIVLGLVIGLVWYFTTRRKGAGTGTEEAREPAKTETRTAEPAAEAEVIEAPSYRTFNG